MEKDKESGFVGSALKSIADDLAPWTRGAQERKEERKRERDRHDSDRSGKPDGSSY